MKVGVRVSLLEAGVRVRVLVRVRAIGLGLKGQG